MSEAKAPVRQTIPEPIMPARLEQSERMREFFIQMWKQNPQLAQQGGEKVRSLMTPLEQAEPKHQQHQMTLVSDSNQVVANCDHLAKEKP
ncbi:MAG: hypothetical protein KJ795_13375 [Gammaproteobacteria bacterium]|nr:hypothetical protein [Gammaproteobacteria bacterium]MBU1776299.1 hypothetical protein [Gammaproteobacteria bacterium]MBU1968369.1 hypothetical protein [Gammaproteobacteria bacterium]